ncbi:MAG: hypothetical protein ACRDPC_22380 [Solirubrobacteraceae bacterium]
MDATVRRALIALLLCAVAVVATERFLGASAREAAASGEITPDIRAEGLRFAPDVSERDRAWILAAIAAARPEAQILIDEVDGLVQVRTHSNQGDTIGWARSGPHGSVISVDTAALNGDRALDRNVVVLHELGHVIDYVLVPDELVARLDQGIPRGECAPGSEPFGACAIAEERFADTFAKWALRGAVSLAGSGYGIPTPTSLEGWGAPLGRLAVELRVAAGT